MSYAITLHFRNGNSSLISVNYVPVAETHLSLCTHIDGSIPLYVDIHHHLLNTQLILNQVTNFSLLFFNDKCIFSGASVSNCNVQGDCSVITQSKKIVFFPNSVEFDLNQVYSLEIMD